MRYKLLGRSGLRVSELALGTMTFGEDWGWGASREASQQMFDAYVEAGGNFIDTANNYTNGSAEKFTGELVAADRDHFVVATKFTLMNPGKQDLNAGGNSRKNMVKTVENSLKRMNTEYIDLLWLHLWDFTTAVDEVMYGLDSLVRSGKVLHIGISDIPAWIISQANTLAELRGWSKFVGLQVPYSIDSRDVERDLLPMAKAFDLTVTTWGVLSGGLLTGKYTQADGEPRRYEDVTLNEQKLAITAAVKVIAEEVDHSPAQVAINWVRQQQPRSEIIPIIGARSLNHLKDNLACLEWQLSTEQLTRLNEVSKINLGFPHSFFDDLQSLAFGDKLPLLDGLRR